MNRWSIEVPMKGLAIGWLTAQLSGTIVTTEYRSYA